MRRIWSWLGQAAFYGLLMVWVGYFSDTPAYSQMPENQALIKLAFSHAGKRLVPCRKRTVEELAQLPAHMRRKMDCPRERSPVHVELEIDGKVIYSSITEPAGIAKDGRSSVYQRVPLINGQHQLHIRMSDDVHTAGFRYTLKKRIKLAPRQVLVIDFDSETNGFILK